MIARVLSESHDHPDVEELHRRAHAPDFLTHQPRGVVQCLRLLPVQQKRWDRDAPGTVHAQRAGIHLFGDDHLGHAPSAAGEVANLIGV